MINSDLLYLKKSNRSTIIKELYGDEIEINILLESLLEEICLKDLTTLNGRIKAISINYHIYKHIPIYLSKDIILITTINKKQFNNIYINVCNISDMIKDENKTVIMFLDGSKIMIDKPYHLIKKYYDQSLKIKKL